MKNIRNLFLLAVGALLVVGCASSGGKSFTDNRWACAAAGGVIGGGMAAIDDNDYIPVGAVVGAGVGLLFCSGKDTDGDGVKDKKDQCPGTPPGSPVDENGCEFDADGDGVVDGSDACPDTPAGARVDARGCELDSDGDGVVDGKDQCPGTPAGVKVDAVGCEMDGDKDGVPDSRDQCPNTAAGQPVNNVGCDLSKEYALEGVKFEFDSATLTADSKAMLDDGLAILKRHPDLKVEVAGHTDSTGGDDYNQGLSERRANAVLEYMVANGANAANLTAKGYGESQPLADNATAEGRAQNRRVVFKH